jgi:phosphoenolpyruvate carboxykinase (ATP)
MKDRLGIQSPAQAEAGVLRAEVGLDGLGLSNLGTQYWNLTAEALYEEIIFRREGTMTHQGPLVVDTGGHTARAANDKFIVREPASENHVWWGDYNRPFSHERFEAILGRLQGYLQGEDVFVQDCFAGADPEYRMPIRIVSELAWHSLFARNMFLAPESAEAHRQHVPEFTVLAVPGFRAHTAIDDTRSGTFILLDFTRRICLIANTAYAGEIKKSVFTILNYLLPLRGVMSMHCSANTGSAGDVALFFGLSGTGKTTLSADPRRRLIGDDEHGWSDGGVFNFEGGCYAKVIRLSPTAEPEIYACTRRFGTILENVVFDPVTRLADLDDDRLTENTRASYPLEFIGNAVAEKRGGHPSNILLLTCDASGVLPPLARLSVDQALYQFISGYTSKIAGTEVGIGAEPETTFSTCFGAPFMVHHPMVYADLLRRKVERYGVGCWLVNTGWIGGPFGVGKRIGIGYTRTLLNAALDGSLDDVPFRRDTVFGFEVPQACEGVPAEILNPSGTWPSQEGYRDKYRQLAARFVENFKKFESECPPEVIAAGPRMT